MDNDEWIREPTAGRVSTESYGRLIANEEGGEMSILGIGTLLYRLAGLFVVVNSLPPLIRLVVEGFNQPDFVVGEFLLLALGVLLWVNASWLSRRTFSEFLGEQVLTAGGSSELFEIGVRLIGIWLIAARGIPSALITIVNNTAIEWNFGSPNTIFTWWHLIPDVIVIAIGLMLLLAPGLVVRRLPQNKVEDRAKA